MFRSFPIRLIACLLLVATPLPGIVAGASSCQAPGVGCETKPCCGVCCRDAVKPAAYSKRSGPHACCSLPAAPRTCRCASHQQRPAAPEPTRPSDRRDRDDACRAESPPAPSVVVPADIIGAGRDDAVTLFSLPTLRRQANLCRWLT